MNKKLLTLCAILGLTAATHAGAAGTTAGTNIVNTAYLESLGDDGTVGTAIPSNPVTLTVQHVPSLSITPDGNATTPGQIVYGQPGQSAVLTYTLTNTSNNTDTVTLSLAATAQAVATDATIYREIDGLPGLTPGDSVVTAGIELDEDESTVFYVVYDVDASAPSSDVYDLTPTGTTLATFGGVPATDSNNLGRIQTRDVYSVSFSGQDQTGTTTSPGTISYTHQLTNNGNTPISATDLSITVGTVPGGWTYSYSVGGAAPAATPEQALINWGGTLLPGESLPIVVIVTAPNGQDQGDTDVTTISVGLTPTPTAEVDNASLTPQEASDTTTIIKGIGGVSKMAASCGMTALCAAPVALNDGALVSPLEYLQYTVIGTNQGDAGLRRTIVTDLLPMNTLGERYSATINGVTGGQLLYRVADGGNVTPWSTTAPSIAGLEGVKVDVGFDSDSDGDVDYDDMLTPGGAITLTLVVRVK